MLPPVPWWPGPGGSLAIVARPWAGSASDPHLSQPIANWHRAGVHYSFSDQWLVIGFGLVNDEERHPPRAYGHCGLKLVTVTLFLLFLLFLLFSFFFFLLLFLLFLYFFFFLLCCCCVLL